MTHDTRDVDEWEKEFDELFEYEPEGCSECLGYSLKDRTQIPYPQGTYHQEYDLEKIKAFIHHQLQKAQRCGKELPDGSICGCRLDCHLHDWRQREEIQKARQDWLREEIDKLEGMKEEPRGPWESQGTDSWNQALQTIIDRYQAELDQDVSK